MDRRLEEVTKAVEGGYCRLQMPLKLRLGVGETLAGHRLGALEGGGGVPSSPSNASLGQGAVVRSSEVEGVERSGNRYLGEWR